jgi:glycerol-3-phosphate acyltransferase PlsX
MGGDRAPGEIVAGGLRAVDEVGTDLILVGREEEITPLLPGGAPPAGVEVLDARDVIAMDDEPLSSVRKQKDSSLVRCAELVREGRADAMVSAGNTGAATVAAVLRLGRISGVPSPALAVTIPVPGDDHPQLLVDAGAVPDPAPERLVQYAVMGAAYLSSRFDLDEPRIGLLSNGEEPGKGDELRKAAYALLQAVPGFVGNVEGRDFMHPGIVDVVVTDGFTGNVALKCLEGAVRSLSALVFRVLESTPEAKQASAVVLPMLLEAAEVYDPDVTGGAALLGVRGVCVISHGSSGANAIVNAVRVAAGGVRVGLISRMEEALARAG